MVIHEKIVLVKITRINNSNSKTSTHENKTQNVKVSQLFFYRESIKIEFFFFFNKDINVMIKGYLIKKMTYWFTS